MTRSILCMGWATSWSCNGILCKLACLRYKRCGVGLNRVDAIASKPAPTIMRLTRSALAAVLTTAAMTTATATAAWRHKHSAA
jgi:hypothetical protein